MAEQKNKKTFGADVKNKIKSFFANRRKNLFDPSNTGTTGWQQNSREQVLFNTNPDGKQKQTTYGWQGPFAYGDYQGSAPTYKEGREKRFREDLNQAAANLPEDKRNELMNQLKGAKNVRQGKKILKGFLTDKTTSDKKENRPTINWERGELFKKPESALMISIKNYMNQRMRDKEKDEEKKLEISDSNAELQEKLNLEGTEGTKGTEVTEGEVTELVDKNKIIDPDITTIKKDNKSSITGKSFAPDETVTATKKGLQTYSGSFSNAFREARKVWLGSGKDKGKQEFIWNGNRYHIYKGSETVPGGIGHHYESKREKEERSKTETKGGNYAPIDPPDIDWDKYKDNPKEGWEKYVEKHKYIETKEGLPNILRQPGYPANQMPEIPAGMWDHYPELYIEGELHKWDKDSMNYLPIGSNKKENREKSDKYEDMDRIAEKMFASSKPNTLSIS
jgi:hypothetical protein